MSETNHLVEPDGTGPGQEPQRLWLHLVWRGLAAVLILAVAVGALVYWRRADHGPRPEGPSAPAGPLAVKVVAVRPTTVPARPTFLGQTEASQTVEIRSRIRGFLVERAFEEGQAVEKDKVLFRIDRKPFEVELASAEARRRSANAMLERAREQLARLTELRKTGAASVEEVQEWEKEERVAAADVGVQEAAVRQAELNLGYTDIKAPIAGVVGQSLKDVGSYVDDGVNGLLVVLRQVDPIYVRYSVSEQELLRWQRLREQGQARWAQQASDMELEVTLSDQRKHPHKGRINFVDVQVDPATGTSVIRGTVPNPENQIKPGQFVHATVLGIDLLSQLMVPQKAVLQSPAGASVYVVNEQGVVEARPVTLGQWIEDQWVIEKGLSAGDRVVVDRLMQVRPGMAVAATPAPAAAAPADAQARR